MIATHAEQSRRRVLHIKSGAAAGTARAAKWADILLLRAGQSAQQSNSGQNLAKRAKAKENLRKNLLLKSLPVFLLLFHLVVFEHFRENQKSSDYYFLS